MKMIAVILTQDKQWVHHFDAESKMQAPWLTPPKKYKRASSAGAVMASVFWDSQGVITIDYLQQGRTIHVHIMQQN